MTEYKNTYKPTAPQIDAKAALQVKPEDYDFNFMFPVKLLRSDRVELRPFVPSLHAQPLLEGCLKYPDTQDYIPHHVETVEELTATIEARRRDPTSMQYTIYTAEPGPDAHTMDPSEYKFAGTLSCINASDKDLTAEPGWIMVFPPYQRTHVLTHAAGLIINYILNCPSQGGLGLRRCQWFCASLNERSQKAALRLGFKFEGILRNHRVLIPGKRGARDGRPDDGKPGHMARDSWLGSITWGEWQDGVKAHIDGLMARRH